MAWASPAFHAHAQVRRIGHRGLRNHSSEVLRAVDKGESFQITTCGRVVALVVPAHPTRPGSAGYPGPHQEPDGNGQAHPTRREVSRTVTLESPNTPESPGEAGAIPALTRNRVRSPLREPEHL